MPPQSKCHVVLHKEWFQMLNHLLPVSSVLDLIARGVHWSVALEHDEWCSTPVDTVKVGLYEVVLVTALSEISLSGHVNEMHNTSIEGVKEILGVRSSSASRQRRIARHSELDAVWYPTFASTILTIVNVGSPRGFPRL